MSEGSIYTIAYELARAEAIQHAITTIKCRHFGCVLIVNGKIVGISNNQPGLLNHAERRVLGYLQCVQ